MLTLTLLQKDTDVVLQDAIQRDLRTARRALLVEILWQERYLTRAQLIVRVEGRLGGGCFGDAAWPPRSASAWAARSATRRAGSSPTAFAPGNPS
jgi:hypothetical protein